MKKLAVIFLCIIVLANSFNLSYIFITTWFYDEDIIEKKIIGEIDELNKQKLFTFQKDISIAEINTDCGTNLVNIDDIRNIRIYSEKNRIDYKLAILNGGYLIQFPVQIYEGKNEYTYIFYINPFTKKIIGISP